MSEMKSRKTWRIVLAVGLLIAIGLKLFDMNARRRANALFQQVSAQLEQGNSLSDTEVHQLVGVPQEGYAPADKEWIDRYSYRGAFKRFDVLVKYSDKAARLLEGVQMQ